MRGITEERLKEIGRYYMPNVILQSFISNECKELNPWQPIDKIALIDTIDYLEDSGSLSAMKLSDKLKIMLARMQELPEDPK